MALAVWNTELDIQNPLTSKPPLPLTGHTRLGRVQCHTATPPARPAGIRPESAELVWPLSFVTGRSSLCSVIPICPLRYSLVTYSLVFMRCL